MFIKICFISLVYSHVSIGKWLSSYPLVLILDQFAAKSNTPIPPLLLLQGIWSLRDVFYRFLQHLAPRRVQPMETFWEMERWGEARVLHPLPTLSWFQLMVGKEDGVNRTTAITTVGSTNNFSSLFRWSRLPSMANFWTVFPLPLSLSPSHFLHDHFPVFSSFGYKFLMWFLFWH